MKNESVTSVRLPDGAKEFMIKRFGSLRGACIAMVETQKLIDKATGDNSGKIQSKKNKK